MALTRFEEGMTVKDLKGVLAHIANDGAEVHVLNSGLCFVEPGNHRALMGLGRRINIAEISDTIFQMNPSKED